MWSCRILFVDSTRSFLFSLVFSKSVAGNFHVVHTEKKWSSLHKDILLPQGICSFVVSLPGFMESMHGAAVSGILSLYLTRMFIVWAKTFSPHLLSKVASCCQRPTFLLSFCGTQFLLVYFDSNIPIGKFGTSSSSCSMEVLPFPRCA